MSYVKKAAMHTTPYPNANLNAYTQEALVEAMKGFITPEGCLKVWDDEILNRANG